MTVQKRLSKLEANMLKLAEEQLQQWVQIIKERFCAGDRRAIAEFFRCAATGRGNIAALRGARLMDAWRDETGPDAWLAMWSFGLSGVISETAAALLDGDAE